MAGQASDRKVSPEIQKQTIVTNQRKTRPVDSWIQKCPYSGKRGPVHLHTPLDIEGLVTRGRAPPIPSSLTLRIGLETRACGLGIERDEPQGLKVGWKVDEGQRRGIGASGEDWWVNRRSTAVRPQIQPPTSISS